jgi:acetoin utilization protein AcuB
MSKPIPPIRKYMSTSPHTIGKDQTLAKAHAMLREHKIRHLPVLDGGKLVGIVTDRDLRLIETLKDVDPEKVTVEDAMSQDVYVVSPESPLDEVARDMAEHKYGSAVVMQNGKVVGIFTTVDGMVALHELLHTRLAK